MAVRLVLPGSADAILCPAGVVGSAASVVGSAASVVGSAVGVVASAACVVAGAASVVASAAGVVASAAGVVASAASVSVAGVVASTVGVVLIPTLPGVPVSPGVQTATGRPASVMLADCGSLPVTTLDTAVPWAQRRLDLQRVWPISRGAGVTVAVVDTGVDGRQPFLHGAVLRGLDVIDGGGPANTDCDGHGTFVAGLIAGRQLPGFGFAGVAPQATILPIRQATSSDNGTALTLAESIRAAVLRHAQVINVSIVTPDPTITLAEAVRFALAHNVVIVAAAGNDFGQGNAVQYPAGFPGVLAVGAVDQSGQRASFSEAGSDVKVVAPGVDLLGPGAGGVGLVRSAGGTSFATAYVSGVAALVRAYHPGLSAAQVIRRIEITADHPPGGLPSPDLGWGVVNPYAAVTAVLPAETVASALPMTPVPRPAVARPRSRTVQAALAAAAAGCLLAGGFPFAAGAIRRARRRGWHPGT